jgi:hypothetical protein
MLACDGIVQGAVENAGIDCPRLASCRTAGDEPNAAPYGSKASALAVSKTIKMTFGRTIQNYARCDLSRQ